MNESDEATVKSDSAFDSEPSSPPPTEALETASPSPSPPFLLTEQGEGSLRYLPTSEQQQLLQEWLRNEKEMELRQRKPRDLKVIHPARDESSLPFDEVRFIATSTSHINATLALLDFNLEDMPYIEEVCSFFLFDAHPMPLKLYPTPEQLREPTLMYGVIFFPR